MIRFFAPEIETDFTLPESDSQHAVRVLRMREGDELEAVDGKGHVFRCRITFAHTKRTSISIIEKIARPKVWQSHITIAIAPTKHNDRMEWLVEKLTEIGVDCIVPLRCRHSERKEINVERLAKIAISAMKQSLKAILPEIRPMTDFNDFVKTESDGSSNRYVAYCDPTIPRELFAHKYSAGKDTVILIGPEGDFSHEEITSAISAGFIPVTFGDNRLRTETAAIVACDTCHIMDQIKSLNYYEN